MPRDDRYEERGRRDPEPSGRRRPGPADSLADRDRGRDRSSLGVQNLSLGPRNSSRTPNFTCMRLNSSNTIMIVTLGKSVAHHENPDLQPTYYCQTHFEKDLTDMDEKLKGLTSHLPNTVSSYTNLEEPEASNLTDELNTILANPTEKGLDKWRALDLCLGLMDRSGRSQDQDRAETIRKSWVKASTLAKNKYRFKNAELATKVGCDPQRFS